MKPNYSQIFQALGDENRLTILRLLGQGQTCGCTLVKQLNISQPTLSYHLRTLTDAGLTVAKKDGTWNKHSLNMATIDELISFFTKLKETSSCK